MRIIYASIGLLLAGFTRIVGQIIGENICACSPSSYTFTLEFDLSCPPVNVAENEAVDDTSCVITSVGDPGVTDLVPVVVQSIDVLELGQGLRIIVQERITGTFVNGDSFNYTSIAAVPGDVVDPTDVPRAIQINIAAINQFDESLLNTFIITFSNSCDAYPVFTEGQSAGWVLFTKLQPPIRDFCPFGTTSFPDSVPSDFPTTSPTTVPSGLPTITPTPEAPFASPIPTTLPSTDASTRAPATEEPTTKTPTLTPISSAPSEKPSTTFPTTSGPTGSPVTSAPTRMTDAPVIMSMSINYGLTDLDSIAEEFGLLKEMHEVPKAKNPSESEKATKKVKAIRTSEREKSAIDELPSSKKHSKKNSTKRRRLV